MKTVAAQELIQAEPAKMWFALRVQARRPSVTNAQLSLVRKTPRPPVLVNGSSGEQEVHYPTRAEFLVQDILMRAGITAWVPVRSVWNCANRYRRYQKVAVYQPLLPGYVLAALPLDARGERGPGVNWARVLACPMVKGIMGFGGVPAPIPPEGIEKLTGIEADEQADEAERLMPTGRSFEVGQRVEFLRGPFAEYRGEVIEITPREARVIFALFGRETTVEVTLDNLGSV